MPLQLERIETEALALSAQERAFLADRLLGSLTGDVLSEVDKAWITVAEQRYSEYKQGYRKGIDASEVLADADQLVN